MSEQSSAGSRGNKPLIAGAVGGLVVAIVLGGGWFAKTKYDERGQSAAPALTAPTASPSVDLASSDWNVVRGNTITASSLMDYAEPLLEEKRAETFDEIVNQGYTSSHPAKFFMPGEASVDESTQETYNRFVIDLRTVWNVAKKDVNQASILLASLIDPGSPESDFDYVQNLLGNGGKPVGSPAEVVDQSAPFYTNYSDLIESNGQSTIIMSVHEREPDGEAGYVNQYGMQWTEGGTHQGWVRKLSKPSEDEEFDINLANLELLTR